MTLIRDRQLKIHYWDLSPRSLNAHKLQIEKELKKVAPNQITPIKQISELDTKADLLIVDASIFDEDTFEKWFYNFKSRMQSSEKIWIPCLVIAEDHNEFIRDELTELLYSNWYFDILHPDHFASVPIRVLNLIKIHDHILEIQQYEKTLTELENKLEKLQKRVTP